MNQLIDDGSSSYEYDFNGNLVLANSTEVTTSFVYDALDRLTQVTKGAERHCYTYDELNRRLTRCKYALVDDAWQIVAVERFLYHGQNEVGIMDMDGRLAQYRMLGTGKGAEIGATVLIELQGKAYVPIHDHIGNIVCLVDPEEGIAVETYRYTTFGEETLFEASGEPMDASINPWRFSSKRVDEETGFVYFGRRYYSPVTGRWVTADPIGFEGGPNLYAYVLNNPLTHFDMYGLFGVDRGFSSAFESTVSTLFNKGREYLQSGFQMAGSAVEMIGLHCIPIPGVQDSVRAVGTLMQGDGCAIFKRGGILVRVLVI